jgi:hypothetical protein
MMIANGVISTLLIAFEIIFNNVQRSFDAQ